MARTSRALREAAAMKYGIVLPSSAETFAGLDALVEREVGAELCGIGALQLALAIGAVLGEEVIRAFGGRWDVSEVYGPSIADSAGREMIHVVALAELRFMAMGVELPIEDARARVYRALLRSGKPEYNSFRDLYAVLRAG
jgi:hypothetical protein